MDGSNWNKREHLYLLYYYLFILGLIFNAYCDTCIVKLIQSYVFGNATKKQLTIIQFKPFRYRIDI